MNKTLLTRDNWRQTSPQQRARAVADCRQQVTSERYIVTNIEIVTRLGFWDTVTGEEIRNIEVTKKGRLTCLDLSTDGK